MINKKIKPINESRGTYVPPSNVQPPPKFKSQEERAKKRFEEAIISLIDERIKTIVGDR